MWSQILTGAIQETDHFSSISSDRSYVRVAWIEFKPLEVLKAWGVHKGTSKKDKIQKTKDKDKEIYVSILFSTYLFSSMFSGRDVHVILREQSNK